MNIIIPMAGRGSRLRPHTLTVPKPLVPVGGKPIVNRLVEDIAAVCGDEIDEIAFVIGDFGAEVEKELIAVAEQVGAKGSIYHQKEPLGTAHAVLCAEEKLNGPCVVAFADTLFKADFKITPEDEGILWVKQIDDPSAFGVVKMDESGTIIDFIEKPQHFVSDLAMIGVYYFKNANELKQELNYLMDKNIIKGGEYQLPDALRRLTEKGTKFKPGKVEEWLDCGNKVVTVHTNQRVLAFDASKNKKLISDSADIINSVVIPPCYIGDDVRIENSVIGPHVSVGSNSKVLDSVIKNTIIQQDATLKNANICNSMLGNKVTYIEKAQNLSLGDFTEIKNG